MTEIDPELYQALNSLRYNDPTVEEKVKTKVLALTSKFPLK